MSSLAGVIAASRRRVVVPFATPVLDSFNRADENPLAGGWVARTDGVVRAMRLVSNRAANSGGGVQEFGVFQSVGPFTDCEGYVTLATVGTGRLQVFARVQGSTSANDIQGVAAEFNFGSGVRLKSINDGSATIHGAAAAWTPVAGDKLGILCQGTIIKIFGFSGGTWTELLSRDQSTFGAPYDGYLSGYLGLGVSAADCRLDDFGGGAR
jgi:hypothetical protein